MTIFLAEFLQRKCSGRFRVFGQALLTHAGVAHNVGLGSPRTLLIPVNFSVCCLCCNWPAFDQEAEFLLVPKNPMEMFEWLKMLNDFDRFCTSDLLDSACRSAD